MRIVFMGTPEFAIPSLNSIYGAGHDIVCVVTQPDRPAGRGQHLRPSPVKTAALALGLRVVQPKRVRDPEFVEAFRRWAPDVAVVAAFGQKITPELLAVPKYGFINVHPSLLPRYRGAAPIERCIMSGDAETGVSIMCMDEGWDTGDVGTCVRMQIPAGADAGWVHERLSHAGGELLVEYLRLLKEGEAPRTPQDNSKATYAGKIAPHDTVIDWNRDAQDIANQVRGLSPYPAARTTLEGRQLKVYCVRPIGESAGNPANELADGMAYAPPGQIIISPRGDLIVVCGPGSVDGCTRGVVLEEVQPAGGRRMSGAEFARGMRLSTGAFMGR